MTALWVIQGILALVAVLLSFAIARRLLVGMGRFDDRFGKAWVGAIRDGDTFRQEAIARSGAMEGDLARAILDAEGEGADVGVALDRAYLTLRFELEKGLGGLRILASFGSMSALVGVGIQFLWLTAGNHGLAGLVPGLPVQMATEAASIAAAAGFSVTLYCAGSKRILGGQARMLLARLRKNAADAESAHDAISASEAGSVESP